MPSQINLMLILSLSASFVFFSSGVINYITTYRNNTRYMYFAVMICMSGWTLSLALMNTTAIPETATLWRNIGAFFWVIGFPTIINFYFAVLKDNINYAVKFKYKALLYLPTLVMFYGLYYMFPYRISDIKLTQFGWVYVNLPPNFNIDHYLFLYTGIYAVVFMLITYNFKRFATLKRQKIMLSQLFWVTFLALAIGSFTDTISAEIEGIDLLPIGGIIVVYIPFILHRSFKMHVLADLESPKLLKQSTQQINEGIVLTKPNHIIGYANDALKSYLSIDDVNTIYSLKFPDDIENITTTADVIKVDQATQSIEKILGGDHFYYEYKLSEVKDIYGDIISLSYIIRDISELKRTQNDLLSAKNKLEEMVDLRTKELQNTTIALKRYNIDLKNEIKQRQVVEARVKFLAYHDSLTECYNRDHFIMRISEYLNASEKSYVYAHIDIRNFRIINDNFGHDIGDLYIKTVAKLLSDYTPAGTDVCRLGGDEFGLFFKTLHTAKEAQQALDKLFIMIGEQIVKRSLKMPLYFTGGIALYPEHTSEVNDLLYKGELAMIEAKPLGENRHVVFQQAFKDNIKKQLDMVEAIDNAIKHDYFKVYYQPQIKRIKDKNIIVGVEALLRWIDPEKGFISPGEFIPIAEKSNQIIQIGQFVLKRALSDIGMLKTMHGKSLSLAINVSSNQFSDEALVDIIREYAETYDIAHHNIEIELTERLLVNASAFSNNMLESIKDLGAMIVIDDFGVEYSSLNYLKRLPIDKVKIDMSFVHGIGQNPKDEIILETMVNLSQRLNLDILSEGIENEQQFHFLAELSGQMAYQGYHFYKPMSIEDLTKPEMIDKMLDI